jgi:hypothetical protein
MHVPEATRGVDLLSVRAALDDALLGLRAVVDPDVLRHDTESLLSRSLRQLYAALASTGDAQGFKRAVDGALGEAREALARLERSGSRDPGVQGIVERLRVSVSGLASVERIPVGLGVELPRGGIASEVPRALVDEPRLLQLQREVLEPAVALPDPEQVPVVEVDPETPSGSPAPSLEALLAEAHAAAAQSDAPPAPAPEPATPAPAPHPDLATSERLLFGEPLTEEELRLARARGFFEDLGMMGLMRRPVDGAPWRTSANVERRLLARLDAILACGIEVFPQLVRQLGESPLPDPELTWGAILLHGMVSGDDMFDQVIRLFRMSDLSDEVALGSVADALRFLPHPRTDGFLRPLLGAPESSVRRLALRALAHRGTLEPVEALRGTHDPDLGVRREAARALGLTVTPVPDAELSRLLADPDAELLEAGLVAALVRRRPMGARAALQLTQEGRGELGRGAVYAALSTAEDGRRAFQQALAGPASPILTEALGWLGDLEAVEALLRRLEAKDPAAAAALQRITGASLTDAFPDPDYEPEALPFGRGWRPPPPFAVLSDDPEVWRAWWSKHQARVQRGVRMRWGRPFCAEALLWEMDQAPLSAAERRLGHLEAVVRTGGALPLDPTDFVVRQERQVQAWRDFLQQRPGQPPPGSWSTRIGV